MCTFDAIKFVEILYHTMNIIIIIKLHSSNKNYFMNLVLQRGSRSYQCKSVSPTNAVPWFFLIIYNCLI